MKGSVYTGKKDSLSTIQNHYCSVSKLSYKNLGNASQIMARLDEDRRLDLRRSHFKVGKESE